MSIAICWLLFNSMQQNKWPSPHIQHYRKGRAW